MPPTPAGCSYYLEARGKRDTITRPLTLLSGLKSGYAHIQRVFRVAVKVFGRGRDLHIGIGIIDLRFSGGPLALVVLVTNENQSRGCRVFLRTAGRRGLRLPDRAA